MAVGQSQSNGRLKASNGRGGADADGTRVLQFEPLALGLMPGGDGNGEALVPDLPDHIRVRVAGVFDEADLDDALAGMDAELIGLDHVKAWVRRLTALLFIDALRRFVGLRAEMPTLHMCFTGNPGTGKTTVAHHMAGILHRLGYVRKKEFVTVTREDLVGKFIGHTAPKTKRVLRQAAGGVLFIDEAYGLYRPDNERDYGAEAVELLLQAMEDQRHDLVVIMAGYKDKMERFLRDVPGLGSRIAHHIHFPDYSLPELMAIAELMLDRRGYRFKPAAQRALAAYLEEEMARPAFANARSVRNALDHARLRQALRLFRLGQRRGELSRRELATIDAKDIRRTEEVPEAMSASA